MGVHKTVLARASGDHWRSLFMVSSEDLPTYMPTVTSHRPLDSSTDQPWGLQFIQFHFDSLVPSLPIALSHFTRDIIFMKSTLTRHFTCSFCCGGLLTLCLIKTGDESIPFVLFKQSIRTYLLVCIYINTILLPEWVNYLALIAQGHHGTVYEALFMLFAAMCCWTRNELVQSCMLQMLLHLNT